MWRHLAAITGNFRREILLQEISDNLFQYIFFTPLLILWLKVGPFSQYIIEKKNEKKTIFFYFAISPGATSKAFRYILPKYHFLIIKDTTVI